MKKIFLVCIFISACRGENANQPTSKLNAVSENGKTSTENLADISEMDFSLCPDYLADAKDLYNKTSNKKSYQLAVAEIVCLLPFLKVDTKQVEEMSDSRVLSKDIKTLTNVVFNMAKKTREKVGTGIKEGTFKRIEASGGCAYLDIYSQVNSSVAKVTLVCQTDPTKKITFTNCKSGVCDNGTDSITYFDSGVLTYKNRDGELSYNFISDNRSNVCLNGGIKVGTTCYYQSPVANKDTGKCSVVCSNLGLKFEPQTCSTTAEVCNSLGKISGYSLNASGSPGMCVYHNYGYVMLASRGDCSQEIAFSDSAIFCACNK